MSKEKLKQTGQLPNVADVVDEPNAFDQLSIPHNPDNDMDETNLNRILSKVQKSFWSCTHVNSFQKYALYVNLHILLNILSKTT